MTLYALVTGTHIPWVLKQKSEKSLLESSRQRWRYNIECDLEEGRWESVAMICACVDRFQLYAVLNMIWNFLFPQNSGNFLTG